MTSATLSSSSADLWQKNNRPPPPPVLTQSKPPSNGDLQEYYWSSSNPFYKKGLVTQNGSTIRNGNASMNMNGSVKRNPFPLTLPLYQNLPRARLRDEGVVPIRPPLQQPTITPVAVYHHSSPILITNSTPNNNVGYKLANGGSPALNGRISTANGSIPYADERRSGWKNEGSGVWTVEAERIVRDDVRRQSNKKTPPIKAPPASATAKYGEKSQRSSPPRSNGRKPQKWSRFMQTLCCCIAPQREIEKRPQSVPRSSQQNGVSRDTVVPPPVTQSTQPSTAKKPSDRGSVTNGNNSAVPPSSNPITQITQGQETGIVMVNGGPLTYPGPDVIPQNVYKTPLEKVLLPPVQHREVNRKCLIIDLDETLVHSSFKPVKNPDFVIPVEIDGIVHQVYVLKRPYVDEFLARVGEKFECVLFTASLAKYADPVADLLDKRGVFRSRLFREACVFHKGNYIKDLARLGRDLNRTIIVDNSPTSYAFHPENAIPVQTWFDDPSDVELLDILPLLDRLAQVDSVYSVLRSSNSSPDSTALLDRPYS